MVLRFGKVGKSFFCHAAACFTWIFFFERNVVVIRRIFNTSATKSFKERKP